MALLLACGPWKLGKMKPEEKMVEFQRFLDDNLEAVWRTRHRRNPNRLREYPYPLNLYFYWDNTIRFRANCRDIQCHDKGDWPQSMIPEKFRSDPDREAYILGIFIDKLERVEDRDIKDFPKWKKPGHFDEGLQQLVKVQDIFVPVKE